MEIKGISKFACTFFRLSSRAFSYRVPTLTRACMQFFKLWEKATSQCKKVTPTYSEFSFKN